MIKAYSREVTKSKQYIPADIVGIKICERFGWTWEEYQNTPERIIRLIIETDSLDAKAQSHKYAKYDK